jgi:hypothetical protein
MKTGDLIHVPAKTSLYLVDEEFEVAGHPVISGYWKPEVPRMALYLESLESESVIYDAAVLIDGKKYFLLSKNIYEMEDPNGY